MIFDIGTKIQELRRKKGTTQAETGEALGVSAQAVSRWENHIGTPDIELLPLIADYFGVTIDDLFSHRTTTAPGKLEEALQRAIAESTDDKLFDNAYRMCENIALGAVAQIKADPEHIDTMPEYNAFSIRDGGFVKLRKRRDGDFFFLLSERDGFGERVDANTDKLVSLFGILSDKTAFRILCLLYSRENVPFTAFYIEKALKITSDEAKRGIGALMLGKIIRDGKVETESGMITVYSVRPDYPFRGMLVFALDMIEQKSENYARAIKREKPLIK